MSAPKRPRGRPPLTPGELTTPPIACRLSVKQYDEIWKEAYRRRMTISEFIRYKLRLPMPPPPEDPQR